MTMSIRKVRGRSRAKSHAGIIIERIRRWLRGTLEPIWRALSGLRFDPSLLTRIKATNPFLLMRAGLFAVLGLVLVWLVISSYLAYQADTARETALDLAGVELAVASAEAAQQSHLQANQSERAPDAPRGAPANLRDRARALAEAVLRRDPLNARALRVLGQLADAAGDEAQAAPLMDAAVHRSLHESIAAYWLMQKSYQQENFAATAYYADTLLRTRPQLVAQVTPFLARMAENKGAADELNKLLASNPPWRGQFFSALPNSISDARTPLNLLLSLRETTTPPTTGDLRSYINFLIGHKFYEVAYYTWLQFLPPEDLSKVGLLFNGSFESAPSGLPFDWVITRGSGVTIDMVPRPDEAQQRALFIEFGYGRVEFNGVSQFMMLAPGTYRFAGRYKGELMGRRGLTWRITCAEGTPLGHSAMVTGTAPAWKNFDFEFSVPARDCRAQSVQLVLDARSASEQFVSGSMWYDELEISRVEQGNAVR